MPIDLVPCDDCHMTFRKDEIQTYKSSSGSKVMLCARCASFRSTGRGY